MKNSHLTADVIIIGGGLAGLTSAIHLKKKGIRVLLIEKNSYPNHKVCGEYISNEVRPYLQWLGIAVETLNPANITQFELSTTNSKIVSSPLPLGGFGVSRYVFDEMLYLRAINEGCLVVKDTVVDTQFDDDFFTITTAKQTYTCRVALGAFGKRTTLDHKLNREFISKKSPWLAIKAHYKGNSPVNTVALHHFKGGYCGVSHVENDRLNICYLVNYSSFKNYKNIEEHQQKVLHENKHLKQLFMESEMLFEAPLTISQISFENKECIEAHILMIGDSAGLINPLCGNGMSMAIHSAKIGSSLVGKYLEGKISRASLEQQYKSAWKKHFSKRIKVGKILARLLTVDWLANLTLELFYKSPALLRYVITKTHGQPITMNQDD